MSKRKGNGRPSRVGAALSGWREHVGPRVRSELQGLALALVCAFLVLALVSYRTADPSFNTAAGAAQPHNLGGMVGAYAADLLFQSLGYAAWFLPLALGVCAARYVVLRPLTRPGWVAVGYTLLCLATAGLLSLGIGQVRIDELEIAAGGAAGELLTRALVRYLNRPGAVLVLAGVWLASLMFTVNLSLYAFWEGVRLRFVEAAYRVRDAWILRREQRAKRRERKGRPKPARHKAPEVEVEAPGPRVEPPPAKVPVQEVFPFAAEVDGYRLPSLDLLDPGSPPEDAPDEEGLRMQSRVLEKKLQDFGVEGTVERVRPGPVITLFEFKPAPGIKINRIVSLEDDLALAMQAQSVRVIAPIPGKAAVGIEIPNHHRQTVYLRDVLSSAAYQESRSRLTLALGKDSAGNPYVADLARMPHLLIAGATGSGKSVAVHAMLASLLFRCTPRDVRLLIVDPKMLELSVYNDIPHLLLPVVTDAKKAAVALRWAVQEMERRYRLMAEEEVRNIITYNRRIEKRVRALRGRPPAEEENTELLPYIVVVIDELADLMMVASKEVEDSIARLAQMARAAGIHLIVATQRPSVDVLTGMIKANFPARIAFKVASRVDSRTILDASGAETLLGGGDMLFLPPGTSRLERLHGSYVSEGEIARLVAFLREQGMPEYREEILREPEPAELDEDPEFDELYDRAVALVAETRQASISMIQRRLKIGYNRAARMIERMEKEGVVGPARGAKPREVLIRKV